MMYETTPLAVARRTWILINELLSCLAHLQELAGMPAPVLAASDLYLVSVLLLLKFYSYDQRSVHLRRRAIETSAASSPVPPWP